MDLVVLQAVTLFYNDLVFSFLFKNQNKNNKQIRIEVDPGLDIHPRTPNVRDLILAGQFKNGKDRSPLWRNFDDRNMTRPSFVSHFIKINYIRMGFIVIMHGYLHLPFRNQLDLN